MKNFNELNKNELLEVVKEYSDYVTEYCFDNDIEPVSINEFYYEDYQEIPHVGDMVIINNIYDDEGMSYWLEGNKHEYYIIDSVEYYSNNKIWIKDCPYAIDITENDIKILRLD